MREAVVFLALVLGFVLLTTGAWCWCEMIRWQVRVRRLRHLERLGVYREGVTDPDAALVDWRLRKR